MSGVRLLDYWSAPDGAGRPVACLATSFTFEADFFAQDCLSRFLGLSMAREEADGVDSIAALLEEEDRLSEVQVSVLVDRSSPAEKRNLRWDVIPVGVPGGLLHAKASILLWERVARIVIGSANLTAAGYRRQIELALAIDVDENCRVPHSVLDDLVGELRHLASLAPAAAVGPRDRAQATIDLLQKRIDGLDLPTSNAGDLRLAVAPGRPGVSPIDRLDMAWKGAQPTLATVLSPFWDDRPDAPAITAVRSRLTGRPAEERWLAAVAAIDPYTGSVQAPPSLAHNVDSLHIFEPPDEERRGLHAKLVVFESRDWTAALIGSSNATEAGMGLHAAHGHHELNLWVGCPVDSRTAKHLRGLTHEGEELDPEDLQCEPVPDEDERAGPYLPDGFVTCLIDAVAPAHVTLHLSPATLPSNWLVRMPGGEELLSSAAWHAGGSEPHVELRLPGTTLPAYLVVEWESADGREKATWTANVEDRSALPPPPELAELPVDLLLAALASTRPLPVALEHELRRRLRTESDAEVDKLDPLQRFDDSGLLLQRARHVSVALWRMQERLARPVRSMDALHWRLYGPIGPVAIADGLLQAATSGTSIPGEAHVLLAELALTVGAVDWAAASAELDPIEVKSLVARVLDTLDERRGDLPAAPGTQLDAYVSDALKAAYR